MSHKIFRWFVSLFFALALSLSGFTPALAAPPANDNFTDAEAIPSLPFSATVDNTEATAEPGEPVGCGDVFKSVWYSFTPTENMAIQVDMIGSTVGANVLKTYLASGPGMSNLTFLACTGSGGSTHLQLEAGRTYYLQVDSSGQGGVLQINMEQIFPPANDGFANADAISSLPFSATVDNTNASLELGEPQGCSFPFRSVWYSFAPAENMTLQVDMSGSAVGGSVNIFLAPGPAISDLTSLACVFSGNSTNFQVEAGKTYYLQVDSFSQPGSLQINLQQITPPANDNFASAEAISSLPFSATVDNTNATLEANEPVGCGFPFRSVWYSFTTAESMSVRVGLAQNNSLGNVSVFLASGSSISDLASLACVSNNGSSNILVEAGKTYYLRLDSFGPAGVLQINVEQIVPPANDNFVNAEAIASLPFSAAVDTTNATIEPGEPQDSSCGSLSRSVWYVVTPTENMAVRVATTGNNLGSVVKIYLASGPGISDLTLQACSFGNSTNLQMQAGKAYYLQVDSSGQVGGLQMNVEQIFPPANDNFAHAESILSLPFTIMVDNTDATIEPGEGTDCLSQFRSVWYSFSPAENMAIRMNAFGSAAPGNVTMYLASGPSISDLTFLTCAAGGSSAKVQVEAGKTYYLRVDSFGQAGAIQVNLVPSVPPSNDNFASAQAIISLPLKTTVDISDATSETDEPQFCGAMLNTAWYSFTATDTTKFRIDTQGSSVSANVNVYHATGNGFNGLQFVQCSGFGGAASFIAQAGGTYYFQVGGVGQDGTAQFNLTSMSTISGRVTDAVTGAPLAGNTEPFAAAQLYRICGEGCLELVNSQNTDGDGRFAFDSYDSGNPLPAGSYHITATGSLYQTGEFGSFDFSSSNLDVGDLPLNPPSMIHGRAVASDSGLPLPGASVTVRRCDGTGCSEFVNSQNTDGNGQFQFNTYYYGARLPAGTYELEIAAILYQTQHIQVTVADGENHDLGDVSIDPFPLIGSVSGRLLDAATGKPISQTFEPYLELYRCFEGECSLVNSMTPDSQGNFRFETEYSGNRLIIGSYQVNAFANQYTNSSTGLFEVGENVDHTLGDIKLNSIPVRFTEVRPCTDIPASGGDCIFSVTLTNGTSKNLTGKVWSMVDNSLPETLAEYTKFQTKDPRDLDLATGKSKVFQFRFTVPANLSSYGTFICPRVFVGQGSQPFLNTIGMRTLFCVIRNAGGFAIASPQQVTSLTQTNTTAAATATEVEPNNSCQTAQDAGTISGPLVINGNLDSSQLPDIDFFRFTGTPGADINIDLEGQATGQGTLNDPLLGFFDSNCDLVTYNGGYGSSTAPLQITVPLDGTFIMAATAYPDYDFIGGANGSYQLVVSPVQYLDSISGVVTDAITGKPLSGIRAPFAFVHLLRCDAFNCFDVNSQSAGSDGNFRFETESNGKSLRVGDYRIVASADQYQFTETERFSVSAGENYDAGNVALNSHPIRFGEAQVCSVPPKGGQCDFSVKITNGLATKFSGKAWSIIDGYEIGSFTNFTSFQADSPLDVSLASGKSTVLRFRFQVRGSVANGASICATVFAGANPIPFFNTVGHRFLFCFVKGSNGFTLMSEQEMQSELELLPLLEIAPNPAPSLPKK